MLIHEYGAVFCLFWGKFTGITLAQEVNGYESNGGFGDPLAIWGIFFKL